LFDAPSGTGQTATKQDEDDGVSAVVTIAVVAMVVCSVALFVFAPALVQLFTVRNPEPLKQAVATDLLRFFAPQVAIYGFITIATALLNAKRRFAAPMFAPILNNLVVVGVLLYANRRIHQITRAKSDQARLAALAGSGTTKLVLGLGTTLGVLAMALALLPSLRATGVRMRWRWQPGHRSVKRIRALSGWTFGYVAANMAAYVFILVAANRRDGDYTAYTQAYSTYYLLPHGLLAVSLMTALQPALSRSFLTKQRGQFRKQLVGGIRTMLAVMIPAAVGYLVLAAPIVRLIAAVGNTSERQTRLIADTLKVFVVGLPSFSVYLLLMNACKAMRDTRVTFEINAVENAINIGASALLYRRFGVQGLAAGFAIAYIVSAFVAGRAVSRRTKGLGGMHLLRATARIAVAALAMGVAAWFASRIGAAVLRPLPRKLALAGQVGAGVGVGVSVYLVIGRVLGIHELVAVQATLSRRLGRPRRIDVASRKPGPKPPGLPPSAATPPTD
jgi:putative peptidoglycan lipid II flippase